MTAEEHSEEPKMPAAEALDARGLVDYADDAIVSRTLVETDGGTITVFAFDAGQGLSEHTAPHEAILQVLDGTAQLTIGGDEVTVREGEVTLMPADVPHSVRAPEQFKMLLCMIR
jgi:quercetin dioxygenase-like cupin family protein